MLFRVWFDSISVSASPAHSAVFVGRLVRLKSIDLQHGPSRFS
ncbi:hypothetical protein RBSH_02827 [Rhodopirellula baltica SH28]|uniref:Uncharacterized protein n=1 Tax=Rhodopirellula baltica SH28 TaxID=993517 RepID=K5DGD1_RHOBT|nr:hypothetical protein RBSH_02827 [Rhodopirellula baltica SH28]